VTRRGGIHRQSAISGIRRSNQEDGQEAGERGTKRPVDGFGSVGVSFPLMPHEFTEREEELEAQAAGGRWGSPPRKHTAIGILDPPVPPKKPVSPTPMIPRTIFKSLTVLILLGLALLAAIMVWNFL
jgi:hypothetical protein